MKIYEYESVYVLLTVLFCCQMRSKNHFPFTCLQFRLSGYLGRNIVTFSCPPIFNFFMDFVLILFCVEVLVQEEVAMLRKRLNRRCWHGYEKGTIWQSWADSSPLPRPPRTVSHPHPDLTFHSYRFWHFYLRNIKYFYFLC